LEPYGDEACFDLGDSERLARHWLVADAVTGELVAAERREAFVIVHEQQFPVVGTFSA
jgi:hypothetical protein